MTQVTLEIFDDVVSTLNKIQNINDTGVELEIPENSVLFENVLNLKLIKKQADKNGIVVHFSTEDVNGNTLIEMIEEGTARFDRKKGDEIMESGGSEEATSAYDTAKSPRKFGLPKLVLPKINLRGFHGTSKFKFGWVLLAVVLAALVIYWDQSRRVATVNIVVNSQPLTRSITIKAKSGAPSSPSDKILAATSVQTTVDVSKETPTTGQKVIGTKADGKAKLGNNTDEAKDFKKGTTLIYKNGDQTLNFLIQDDVTVPARTSVDPLDPLSAKTPGTEEVSIQAESVGTDYNIKSGKTLEIKGVKKSDYPATTSEDLTGGKSEIKKVVADADLAKLLADVTQETQNQAQSSLAEKIANSQQLIKGSEKTTLISSSSNHKVGDEATTVSTTRTSEVQGLVYMKTELDRLLDSLVKEFIPAGFVLSDKDREVNVEVLGNSTSSVLTSTEADLQVTLKAFDVPDITENKVREQLVGKSQAEAQNVLNGIQNVKTYSLKTEGAFLPLSRRLPKNPDKIKVSIERD